MATPPKCPVCKGALIVVLDEPMGRSWDCEKCDFTFDEDFNEETSNHIVDLATGDFREQE